MAATNQTQIIPIGSHTSPDKSSMQNSNKGSFVGGGPTQIPLI